MTKTCDPGAELDAIYNRFIETVQMPQKSGETFLRYRLRGFYPDHQRFEKREDAIARFWTAIHDATPDSELKPEQAPEPTGDTAEQKLERFYNYFVRPNVTVSDDSHWGIPYGPNNYKAFHFSSREKAIESLDRWMRTVEQEVDRGAAPYR